MRPMPRTSMPALDQSNPDGSRAIAPKRILHVLDHSEPHRSGYAIRSKSIIQFQRELGLEPVVLTSPKHGPAPAPLEVIRDVAHHRTAPLAKGFGRNIPFLRE